MGKALQVYVTDDMLAAIESERIRRGNGKNPMPVNSFIKLALQRFLYGGEDEEEISTPRVQDPDADRIQAEYDEYEAKFREIMGRKNPDGSPYDKFTPEEREVIRERNARVHSRQVALGLRTQRDPEKGLRADGTVAPGPAKQRPIARRYEE